MQPINEYNKYVQYVLIIYECYVYIYIYIQSDLIFYPLET